MGKGQVGKGGVVREPVRQQEAVAKVAAAAAALGFQVSPAFPSPLKGPKGNQEYFLYLIGPGAEPGAAAGVDKDLKEF
ncbi:MAG: SAM-dependent methyltransferase [Desulfobaccales bacterium]